MSGSLFALQFLTVVPPFVRRPPTVAELGAAESFFPLVGLGLGLGLAAVDAALSAQLASSVRDVILVVALVATTGALHLDGLIDSFDGVFAGPDAAARLAIMRDPRAGAFGVAAVICVLLLKVAALGALPSHLRPAGLILGPCLGRWAIVQSTWTFPYARPQGLGRAFKDGMTWVHGVIALAITAGAAAWLVGAVGLAVLVAVAIGTWIVGHSVARRLGGLTGDTYGGICEIVETVTWVVLGTALIGRIS